ncbi:protease modulator HflC [Tuwongella immobilis]|uniref:Protein HflC n=1 Tax=Tuwongella immobilis TaxID=692036 RepID=A0A6C2YQ49_9BACT|nr:protease modulator HflC [Tuwongella immobilis]VIP03145.1 membrane protein : Protein HflC OS=Thiorhodococcus sp. AK35 GN=D779_2892 PE=3 SV=1: Band_7 [Tuwongella immobilis]VTS03522.1 membrane protein : Protein HflC OS=Thiorhodococcus sp. AK35 GN=D779_2892 PE=3 SV=1: Band_7 [Tuwongella immobilis]
MRFWLILAILIVVPITAVTSFFSVDQTEFAYVTRFGSPIAIFDGSTEAGLHWKLPWPIDSVRRLDRRVHLLDLPPLETLTLDRENRTVDKTLAVEGFVCWRIPDKAAVDRFIRTVGTPEQARRLLAPRLNGRLAAVMSNIPLDELIRLANPVETAERAEAFRRQWLGLENVRGGAGAGTERLAAIAREDYGIEILDVRLRRVNFPEAVRTSIAERIRSERARKVAEYESEGRQKATEISSTAERDARKLEATAKAERQRLEGEADAQADAIRNQAHAQDREFYTFLQKLKSYQSMISESRDMLLLSTQHPWFDLFLKPPTIPKPPQMPQSDAKP